MTACIGIKSEAELAAALGAGGVSGIGHDTASGKGDLLVLENDFTLNNAVTVDTVTPFTLISGPGTSRTVTRGSGTLILPAGASLTLGRDGESGGLIIDNAGRSGGMFRKGGALSGTVSSGSLAFGGNTSIINAACSLTASGGWAAAVQAVNESLGACVIDIGTGNLDLPPSGETGNPELESGADLTLKGSGTISLSGQGRLFTVNNSVTLTLDGPTLQGQSANTDSLVFVEGGTFAMKDGSITGNQASSGGGVYAHNGSIAMSGGTISGNSATVGGGGVYITSSVNFTMSGGFISNNTGGEGGVVVVYGTFNMSGGTISGNSATGSGGGVYVFRRGFTMSGGTITGNTASGNGGGVCISDATFTMSGGIIRENTSYNGGGGVSVTNNSTFNLDRPASVSSFTLNTASGTGPNVFCDANSTIKINGTVNNNSW
jgi:hypothetical protein